MWIKTAEGWRQLPVKSIPAQRSKTLLEEMGYTNALGDYRGYFADKYCEAVDEYINHRHEYAESGMEAAYRTMVRKQSAAIRGIRLK